MERFSFQKKSTPCKLSEGPPEKDGCEVESESPERSSNCEAAALKEAIPFHWRGLRLNVLESPACREQT